MNAAQFQQTAIAILRSAVGWQTAIAKRLGVESRTVRRWISDDQTPKWGDEEGLDRAGARLVSPKWADDKLMELTGACLISPWPRDEWVVGDGVTADGTRREYIIHLAPPRFAARIVALDDDGNPDHHETPVDVITGSAYQIDVDTMLCEVDWLDQPRPGEIAALFEAAAAAIDETNRRAVAEFGA